MPNEIVAVAVRFSTREALARAVEAHQAFWSPTYSDPNARAIDLARIDAMIQGFKALVSGASRVTP